MGWRKVGGGTAGESKTKQSMPKIISVTFQIHVLCLPLLSIKEVFGFFTEKECLILFDSFNLLNKCI